MIFFKIFLFCVVLAEMRHVEALSIADMIATFNSTTNVTSQNIGNCPPCICQCVPIVFPACSSPTVTPGMTAALTSNTTQVPTTLAPTTVPLTTAVPTTIPPTTLPPTTIPPLKASVCTTTYQIKTAANTNLKMLCYIAGNPLSTENAAIFCANNGMTLYELADADSVAGYQEFVNYYVLSNGPRFIANGVLVNNQWMLHTNTQVPVYSGITWGPPQATVLSPPPIFLYAREVNMTYNGYAFNYDSAAYFMCQF